MRSPCIKYIRLRYFLGMTSQELSQHINSMSLPVLGQGSELIEVRDNDVLATFRGDPRVGGRPRLTSVGGPEDPEIASLQPDSKLGPLEYAQRHEIEDYCSEEGQVLVVESAKIWDNGFLRALICRESLKGVGPHSLVAEVKAQYGKEIPQRVLVSFLDLFWRLAPFTSSEVLALLSEGSALSDVSRMSSGGSDEVLRRLGLVESTQSDMQLVEGLKALVYESIQGLRSEGKIYERSTSLKDLAGVLHQVTAVESAVRAKVEEEEAYSMSEDETQGIPVLSLEAVERYEAKILPRVTQDQRLMEIDTALQEELISRDDAARYREKVLNGEMIGPQIRELIQQVPDDTPSPNSRSSTPPREEDGYL